MAIGGTDEPHSLEMEAQVQQSPLAAPGERLDVRVLRSVVQRWPTQRGRGRLIAAWRHLFERESELVFEIGGGARAYLEFDDYMVQWAFVGDDRRDRDYQRSLQMVGPTSVVIDVGANIGLWSLVAARRASAGSVHSFEPAPATFERLRRNTRLNRLTNVCANQLAVDREAGVTTFHQADPSNSGGSGYLRRAGAQTPVTVERTTLDEYCVGHGIERVDLIKLDIEGAEWLALQGAERLLSGDRPPAIFMELDGDLTRQFGWEPGEVLQWLAERGYHPRRAAPAGRFVDPGSAEVPARDLFALHETML